MCVFFSMCEFVSTCMDDSMLVWSKCVSCPFELANVWIYYLSNWWVCICVCISVYLCMNEGLNFLVSVSISVCIYVSMFLFEILFMCWRKWMDEQEHLNVYICAPIVSGFVFLWSCLFSDKYLCAESGSHLHQRPMDNTFTCPFGPEAPGSEF